jgi:hypothetical protein
MLSRRQLQGFVGLPVNGTTQRSRMKSGNVTSQMLLPRWKVYKTILCAEDQSLETSSRNTLTKKS